LLLGLLALVGRAAFEGLEEVLNNGGGFVGGIVVITVVVVLVLLAGRWVTVWVKFS